jgi:hypothetical protein
MSPTLDAETFLDALADALPGPAFPVPDDERWLPWLAQALHRAAVALDRACCCELAAHAPEPDPDHGVPRGYAATYVYDQTWYTRWHTWELPSVAIQLQGARRFDAFLAAWWRLNLSAAPLRVAFARAHEADDALVWRELIHGTAAEAGWAPPADVEDLLLLGWEGMPPRGLRVLHRPRGAAQFVDRGRLDARG